MMCAFVLTTFIDLLPEVNLDTVYLGEVLVSSCTQPHCAFETNIQRAHIPVRVLEVQVSCFASGGTFWDQDCPS